jgi:hypothetical protein
MNNARIVRAACLPGLFAFAGVAFTLIPSRKNEFLKYPAVYRSQDGLKAVMPFGMAARLGAMAMLAAIYAML